ncbi:MAG: hypothetical protein KGJ35_02550 [Patescibacteria group bacterium]|nr:hypothetical protein [Patescibacteria group bacterium]
MKPTHNVGTFANGSVFVNIDIPTGYDAAEFKFGQDTNSLVPLRSTGLAHVIIPKTNMSVAGANYYVTARCTGQNGQTEWCDPILLPNANTAAAGAANNTASWASRWARFKAWCSRLKSRLGNAFGRAKPWLKPAAITVMNLALLGLAVWFAWMGWCLLPFHHHGTPALVPPVAQTASTNGVAQAIATSTNGTSQASASVVATNGVAQASASAVATNNVAAATASAGTNAAASQATASIGNSGQTIAASATGNQSTNPIVFIWNWGNGKVKTGDIHTESGVNHISVPAAPAVAPTPINITVTNTTIIIKEPVPTPQAQSGQFNPMLQPNGGISRYDPFPLATARENQLEANLMADNSSPSIIPVPMPVPVAINSGYYGYSGYPIVLGGGYCGGPFGGDRFGFGRRHRWR